MDIIINDQPKTFEQQQLTVQQLLDLELPDKQKGVAVALNQAVVPRTEWSRKAILPNDNILIIKATQGG